MGTRENAQAEHFRPWMGGALQAAEPHADFLEQTEGAGRLRLVAESMQQGALE
jgi:hypothetical protein